MILVLVVSFIMLHRQAQKSPDAQAKPVET